MRHRINNYTIDGQNIVLEENITIEDVRLIVNETQNIVICSSMQKAKVTVNDNKINVPINVCNLSSNDKLTIEIDKGTDLKHIDNELKYVKDEISKLTALDSDIKAGKKELALQISRKGRDVSENDTLLQMAEQVRGISQNPITFEGKAEYEKQMFGSPTNTTISYQQDGPLWNLYKVMTDLLNDGRFTEYGGILLAEYYKGYDTIELMNAGAGGAYFTCDGDFYQEDKTGDNAHVWHDSDNGMSNRWIAYLFSSPGTNYTIPSTNLCPRSIHIGRHVGTILCSVEGRISDIIVTDGNELDGTNFSSTQNWGEKVIIKNLKNTNSVLINPNKSSYIDISTEFANSYIINSTQPSIIREIVIRKLKEANNNIIVNNHINQIAFNELVKISFPDLEVVSSNTSAIIFLMSFHGRHVDCFSNLQEISFPKLRELNTAYLCYIYYAQWTSKIRRLVLPSLTTINHGGILYCDIFNNYRELEEIILPELTSCVNDSINSFIKVPIDIPSLKRIYMPKLERLDYLITFHNWNGNILSGLVDLEVGPLEYSFNAAKWNPTTVLSTPDGIATINANIRNHIAAKISDRTGQTALTFTVSTNLYDNLEQETIDAFTAKNWNVAGA